MVKYTPDDPAMEKWRKLIEAKFPGDRLSVFNLFGIGSAQVLVEALKRAGPDLTREKLVSELANIREFSVDVYGAPITCTAEDHRCNKAPAWLAKEPSGPVKVLSITRVN
jgi:branched-chain amino acid transport system substrate-binding protein